MAWDSLRTGSVLLSFGYLPCSHVGNPSHWCGVLRHCSWISRDRVVCGSTKKVNLRVALAAVGDGHLCGQPGHWPQWLKLLHNTLMLSSHVPCSVSEGWIPVGKTPLIFLSTFSLWRKPVVGHYCFLFLILSLHLFPFAFYFSFDFNSCIF